MMRDFISPIFVAAGQSKLFQTLIILVVMDVIFGCFRAVKEKRFNSSVGINGMIRKAGMLVSLVCMVYLDNIVDLNLIGFVPEGIRGYLPAETLGIMGFFALIYIVYEVVSVLKNMSLSGLPVERIWAALRKFLETNTSEIAVLPDDEEVSKDGTADN